MTNLSGDCFVLFFWKGKRSVPSSSCSSPALCLCRPLIRVVWFGKHHPVFQAFILGLPPPLTSHSLVFLAARRKVFQSRRFNVKAPLRLMASEALWTSHPWSEMDQNGGTRLWRFLRAMSGLILGVYVIGVLDSIFGSCQILLTFQSCIAQLSIIFSLPRVSRTSKGRFFFILACCCCCFLRNVLYTDLAFDLSDWSLE